MDEAVAVEVQVDTLGGDVRAEKQAHRALRVAEVLHHALLLDVAHGAVEDFELALAELQVPGQLLLKPAQRLDAFGEHDEAIRGVVRLPAKRLAAGDRGEQSPVLGVVAGTDADEGFAQSLEGFHFGGDPCIRFSLELALPASDSVVDRLHAGGGAREERLLQGDDEQIAPRGGGAGRGWCAESEFGSVAGYRRDVWAGFRIGGPAPRRHLHCEQSVVGGFLQGRRGAWAAVDLAIAERVPNLVPDILLEPADHQPLVAEILLRVGVRIGDGGGVEHVHEAREAARAAVVRRRREHDEGVGATRQQAGQATAERTRAPIRDVVRLVDDDHVPVRLLQVGAVLRILLQRVDGDDRLVVVVERIVVGRDAAPHPLDADGVEPRERDREPVPELLLELGEHALHREHQDAPGAPAGDQLAHQDAGLQGLAESDRIRNQDALPGSGEGLSGRVELVGHEIHGGLVPYVDAAVVGDGGAKLALHVQNERVNAIRTLYTRQLGEPHGRIYRKRQGKELEGHLKDLRREIARANSVLEDKIETALRKQLDDLAETYSRQTTRGALPEMNKERMSDLLHKAWHEAGAVRRREVELEVTFKDLTWETLQDATMRERIVEQFPDLENSTLYREYRAHTPTPEA